MLGKDLGNRACALRACLPLPKLSASLCMSHVPRPGDKLAPRVPELNLPVVHVVFNQVSLYLDDDVLFIGTRFSNLYTAVDTPA
jgi:hypothetical protein